MRYLIIALGLFTGITAFWMTAYTASLYSPIPLIYVLIVTLWVNCLALIYCGVRGVGPVAGRLGRMGKLWLDAKEAELKKKAGA